jgi:putative transposase
MFGVLASRKGAVPAEKASVCFGSSRLACRRMARTSGRVTACRWRRCFFHTIHAFVSVQLELPRVVQCGATDHPTDSCVAQQLREATPVDQKPKYVVCGHEQKYGAEFERVAQTTGIELKRTPYHRPVANAIYERFVGSVRRECLDHILVLGVRPLLRILNDYVSYFNRARPHQPSRSGYPKQPSHHLASRKRGR